MRTASKSLLAIEVISCVWNEVNQEELCNNKPTTRDGTVIYSFLITIVTPDVREC